MLEIALCRLAVQGKSGNASWRGPAGVIQGIDAGEGGKCRAERSYERPSLTCLLPSFYITF